MIAGAELLPVITPTSTNPANEVTRALTGRVLGVEEEIRGTLIQGVPGLYARCTGITAHIARTRP